MLKTAEGSTGRLLELCFWYFFFYVFTGIMPKYFLYMGVGDIEYTAWSTIGGNILCLLFVFALGWYHFTSTNWTTIAGIRMPKEYLYIIPSGFCTAVVIATTTLLYTLAISVMVAQIIMRGSIIVISRCVDFIQGRQGILKKKVLWQEEAGVIIAILAVSVQLKYANVADFEFIHNIPALIILGSYVTAYAIRIYIMNYYKNTRPKDAVYDYKGFFAIEQIAATLAIILFGLWVFYGVNSDLKQVKDFRKAFTDPTSFYLVNDATELDYNTAQLESGKTVINKFSFQFPEGSGQSKLISIALPPWEIVGGMFFGAVAFFSVFIFMFKGRTATFAGLVNRLTSLVAGTTATLISFYLGLGRWPKTADWISLCFIFLALGMISWAEVRRNAELKANPVQDSSQTK